MADESPPPDGHAPVSKRTALVVAALLFGTLVAAALLFGGGGSGDPKLPSSSPTIDGTLTVVEPDRLVLRPFDGGRELTLTVRPENVDRLNLGHLRAHASSGLGTRVYYERSGERYFAIAAADIRLPGR